ncbi:hypothetical protein BDP55DRAFT_730500 [Colletotrichum godetiae]|uniref:Accumulation-associated protein n=1 Tax=Colletotrichum godetiae TaxID=1209918 RepID=A0AAJ0AGA2_9PEZI|nr:uncharacterized protein BDP55DRAFT_730500 [Colletotrichum godetiae]KAK1673361.1 hypothetical protein BDP55DRAFT_730500 [Colletotrichum godetiae]
MRPSTLATISCQLLLAVSLPISTIEVLSRSNSITKASVGLGLAERSLAQSVATAPSKVTEKEAAAGETGAAEGAVGGAEGGAAGGGEEAKDPNEKEIEGQFIVPVRLGGANVKQDVLFPPAKNGRFEVEFQNAVGRTLTVTENRSPAPPPAGFTAIEAVSYKVSLAEGAQGVTLSKIDYILNPGNTLDISKGQVGRLFPELNAFIIDPALGELEFEAEENELTLKVANMNGEFAFFLPQAGAAAGATA